MKKIRTIWVITNKFFGSESVNQKIYYREKDAKAALTQFKKDPNYGTSYKIKTGEILY